MSPLMCAAIPFGFIATVNPDGSLRSRSTPRPIASCDRARKARRCSRMASPATSPGRRWPSATPSGRRHGDARAFGDALKSRGSLVDRRADATLPDGRTLGLDGFQIVDAGDISGELADDVVLDWHKKGWLAPVHFHFASLERFRLLLSRQAAAAPVAAMSQAGGFALEADLAPGAVPAERFQSKKSRIMIVRSLLLPALLLSTTPAMAAQTVGGAGAAPPPAPAAQPLGGPVVPGVCLLSREAVFANAAVGKAASARLAELASIAQRKTSMRSASRCWK